MNAALRTEWRKIATTRLWWVTALVMLAYMLVMGAVMALSFAFGSEASTMPGGEPMALDPRDIASSVYTLAVALGYIFPAILGALTVTAEFRHRTITPTLLAQPRRSLVLGAKLAVVLPYALAVSVAGVVGTLLGGASALAIMGEPTFLADAAMWRTIAMSVVALALWSRWGSASGRS